MLHLTQPFMMAYNITEPHVDAALNDIYSQIASLTGSLRKTFDITTVANQNGYALTSESALFIERVSYDIDDTAGSGDYGDDLTEISPLDPTGVMTYGIPTEYWLEQLRHRDNRKIYFNPIPSTAGVSIRVWATILGTELSSDTDNFQFLSYYNEVIVYGAVRMLGAVGNGIPNLQHYNAQYELNLERIRRYIEERQPNKTYCTTYRETWQ